MSNKRVDYMWMWRRERREETRGNTVTERGGQRGSQEEEGGEGEVSQRICVPAHAALSSADHDNLTIVICRSTRDSRLRVALAAPTGGIDCQAETSDGAGIVTTSKIFLRECRN